MSTYAGKDDCTDIILDQIVAKRESDDNYNAEIGDAHDTYDLSHLTLDEIYGLMEKRLLMGEPSTAMGRYQIIRGTLRNLQKSKGLPGSTLFTPELQDNLALSLMVGHGYSKWYIGNMTDAEFAHGLSLEWASLPDPENGGKSHYDGVGPNHAGLTLEYVYATLQKARSAQKPRPATPQPKTPEAPPAPPSAPVEAPVVEAPPPPVATPIPETPPSGPSFWGWLGDLFRSI